MKCYFFSGKGAGRARRHANSKDFGIFSPKITQHNTVNVYRQNIEELVPHAIHIQKLIITQLFISSDTVASNYLCFV